DEVGDPALVLGRHHLVRIERALDVRPAAAAAVDAGHLAGDLAAVAGRIERGDAPGARAPGHDVLPADFAPPPEGRHQAYASDYDATLSIAASLPDAAGVRKRQGRRSAPGATASAVDPLLDEFHRIAHGLDVFGCVIRDFDVELFFESHHQFDVVEAVG